MALEGRLAAVLAACYRKGHCRLYQTGMASLLVPPASVRGMTRLDPDAFNITKEVPYLNLGQANLAKVMPTLKKYILKMEKLKPVQDAEDGKRAYLDPEKVKSLEDIAELDRALLAEHDVKELRKADITLSYENWRSDQVLKAILPEGTEVPTSYSKIGHIIHLNLRDSQLPYRNLIGQVLLDKIAHARTVVNKLNIIDTTFRHFSMELLAGDDDTLATVAENGCTYKFDFASVYWNPRLCTEHAALVALLKPGDVLYDVFAGVGPFAIPAARNGVKVLANDLNPESHKWLRENAKANKAQKNLRTYNKDGREFLREDVKADIIDRRGRKVSGSEHIAMNLPAMAADFLDVFSDWLTEEQAKEVSTDPPMVHLYCFVKLGRGENPYDFAKLLVEEKLDVKLDAKSLIKIHKERMAKNKGGQKTKNVFKVAGARSLKLKAKSQKVSADLKKLDLKGNKNTAKGKTAQVDKQLVELRKEVSQTKPQKSQTNTNEKQQPEQKKKPASRMATRARTEAAANLVQGMQI